MLLSDLNVSVVILCVFQLLAVTLAGRTAFVEIVVCDKTERRSPVYKDKIQGTFANVGTLNRAQGDVLQIHPFGLCNISNDDALYDDEWVGVVKLTGPSQESRACNDTVKKALGAVKKGAKAVIFDVTDSPHAAHELNLKRTLVARPVIVISGKAAKKLMRIVSRQKVLKVRISLQPHMGQTKDSSGEYVDMVIFMTCFILITITCFILLLKIKWKQNKKESSLAKMAFDAVSKMESKKYDEKYDVEIVKKMKEKQWETSLSSYSCSVAGISCVICLEEFRQGQEIRVVSCGHEFHLKCVDPWLLTNYTCPLCMLNIVEREGKGIKTENRCTLSFRSLFRCCFAPSPLSSQSMVYSVSVDDSPNENLPITINEVTETGHYESSTTNETFCREHLSLTSLGSWKQIQTTSCNLGEEGGQASSFLLRNKDTDLLQNSADRGPTSKEMRRENEGWIQNKAKAVQIADLSARKYAHHGDAV